MKNFKKITLSLALAAASVVGAPASAAIQTVDAVGYTFSFDDVLWGLPQGTSFSSAGDVFTFANLGYSTSSTVRRSGSSNSSYLDMFNNLNSITVTAKAGYQITDIVTGATGTVSGTSASGPFSEAGANVSAGMSTWFTDTGVGYLLAAQNVGADLLVGNGATEVRHYSVTDAGQFAFLPGTSSAAGYYSVWGGTKTAGAGSTAFASQDTASFSVAVSAVSPIPEPQTYALLLGGLALVAAAARRRRK